MSGLLIRKRATSALLLLAWLALPACQIAERTPTGDDPPDDPPDAVNPGVVSDFALAGVSDSSVTLSFTEVDNGAGQPASYEIRRQNGAISWGSAAGVSQGTCATPVAGTAIGAQRSCTVLGLAAATGYQFQLVAFRGTLNVDAVFGSLSNVVGGTTTAGTTVQVDTIFAEDFESGSVDAWQDGVNASLHRVISNSSLAQSGGYLLEVTYPAGGDGGWLTRWFMPGYDSLYVSFWVRFPATWLGGTKLLAFSGSRTDDQWSAFGRAGECPTGTDFFSAMVVTEGTGNPGPTRFYAYYPAMAREPDGVTCWGRVSDGTETYLSPLALSAGSWHHVEYWMKLNAPDRADAVQTFWLDGVQRGSWNGLSFRTSTILKLNSVQLNFSNSASTIQTQKLYIDNLVVLTGRPTP